MGNKNEIQKLLFLIAQLLVLNGEISWSNDIKSILTELERNPLDSASKIRGLFGGMGSFNDLVLHCNGQVLYEENELLARYKKALFAQIYS